MFKAICYSNFFLPFLRFFFGQFYEKKYLTGFFFDKKRIGWYWALIGLKGRIVGPNRKIPWPVNNNTIVAHSYNLEFDPDNINIFQTPGCYWQNHDAKIIVGKGTFIAPNVGIITTNHNIYNLSKHEKGKDIIIGQNCWIGMNAVVLPGVILGKHTIVAAGAVVTKSYEDGYCVIGGVPAKIIKLLDKNKILENV